MTKKDKPKPVRIKIGRLFEMNKEAHESVQSGFGNIYEISYIYPSKTMVDAKNIYSNIIIRTHTNNIGSKPIFKVIRKTDDYNKYQGVLRHGRRTRKRTEENREDKD